MIFIKINSSKTQALASLHSIVQLNKIKTLFLNINILLHMHLLTCFLNIKFNYLGWSDILLNLALVESFPLNRLENCYELKFLNLTFNCYYLKLKLFTIWFF